MCGEGEEGGEGGEGRDGWLVGWVVGVVVPKIFKNLNSFIYQKWDPLRYT